MKRKMLPAAAAITMMLFTSGTAFAQAKDEKGPPPVPPAFAEISAEDRAALDKLFDDHRTKTAPLRDQLWAKRMEYEALSDNPNVKPDEIKALVAEMSKLRTQLRGERDTLRKALNDKGFDRRHFRGYHGHKARFYDHGGFYDDDRDFGRPGPPRHGKGPRVHHYNGGDWDND